MSDSAPDPITPPAAGTVPGERHVSDVAGHQRGVRKATGVGVIIAGTILACGVILLTAEQPDLGSKDGPVPAVRAAVRYEPPPPPPLEPVVLPLTPAPPPLPPAPTTRAIPTTAKPRQPDRLLVYTTRSHSDQPAALAPMQALGAAKGDGGDGGVPGGDDLAARLRPTPLTGVAARLLHNQPYLLTAGTMIPCILQTAMDSSLPGLVSCLVPQDVLGKTGLTLLDRGTRVVGQFRGGVQQGAERLFVVWTRAETPQGVVIALDSPATDPLGRSGLDGAVDRHFWQRFGGALLLSTVEGVIQAGVAAAAKEGTTTINTGQTQAVIAESLRGSIAIPPTVRKNQGDLVSILVARDLDFSGVYTVEPAAAPSGPAGFLERGP
ncbi:type IV secretion system protein VirB10 [Azospirillum sp. A1-3]|uniref:type IV secretion system protein VirB10 n=1 Tax=Azospirillum sp. A1-3 TaxID=185874 RepID=UPI0020776141|nr:type IV secretion system protein VirB10 [Azospirillum sp. A1-3]MCM8738851.1 type IV secretion system protein VirB10 [Azospirillum sp. A1-3]